MYNFLYSSSYNDPAVGAKLNAYDLDSGNYTSLYGALFLGDPSSPALTCSHHLIVRKDFLIRGRINCYEGWIDLHGGAGNPVYREWEPEPYNPTIFLARGGDYGPYNTLEIRKIVSGQWGWGDLACGYLYLTGNTNGYLWNNGGYIRQSGGYGFVDDGALVVGSPVNTTYRGPLYIDSNNRIGYNQSSERFKQNIQTLTDTAWIYNLRAVTFDWKDQQRQNDEGTMMGLIAEQVSELCSKLVWLDKEGKPEGVHYEWLGIPILVELQKLKREVDEIKAKLAA